MHYKYSVPKRAWFLYLVSPVHLLSPLQLGGRSWLCPFQSCWLRLSSSFLLLRRFLRHLFLYLSLASESECALCWPLQISAVFFLIQTVWVSSLSQIVSNFFPRYLIFVMCVTTLIATNQIVVLNFSLRRPSTHTMSYTIKHVSTSRKVEFVYLRMIFFCELTLSLLLLTGVPRDGTSFPGHGPTGGWQWGDNRGQWSEGEAAQLLRPHAESRGICTEATTQWNDVWQTKREAWSHTIDR